MFSELPSATSTKIAQTFGDMVEQDKTDRASVCMLDETSDAIISKFFIVKCSVGKCLPPQKLL